MLPFYTFVEEQPMLSAKEELQYGRAIKVWQYCENIRNELLQEKLASMANMTKAVATTTLSENGTLHKDLKLEYVNSDSNSQSMSDVSDLSDDSNSNVPPSLGSVEDLGSTVDHKLPVMSDEASARITGTVPSIDEIVNINMKSSAISTGKVTSISTSTSVSEASSGPVIPPSSIQSDGNSKKVTTSSAKSQPTSKPSTIDVIITDQELASKIGCSVTTIAKMRRFADIGKSKLVNSNLKLVLAVVSRYRTSGIPNAELIAEGTRGLAKASIRYDYSKGFRFATYATWYVHQAICDYVRWRKHPAKMPSKYILLLRKAQIFSKTFRETNKRSPSLSELADALNASKYDLMKVMSMQTYPVLLNSPINNNLNSYKSSTEKTVGDLLPSLFKTPYDQSAGKDLRRDMETMMLVNLNEVERDVLRLRLGLDDGRVKAVKEIGRRFHISWKEVRNVEKKALSKILDSREISEFVDAYNSV